MFCPTNTFGKVLPIYDELLSKRKKLKRFPPKKDVNYNSYYNMNHEHYVDRYLDYLLSFQKPRLASRAIMINLNVIYVSDKFVAHLIFY